MITPLSRYHNWMTARWRSHLIESSLKLAPAEAAAIEARLDTAVIVEPDEILESRVQFGACVTVFSIDEEEEQRFQIVSVDESLSGPGLLAESSPLAEALYGAREGDVVDVVLHNGLSCQYEVTHIRRPV